MISEKKINVKSRAIEDSLQVIGERGNGIFMAKIQASNSSLEQCVAKYHSIFKQKDEKF